MKNPVDTLCEIIKNAQGIVKLAEMIPMATSSVEVAMIIQAIERYYQNIKEIEEDC
jgi:hypothetical protein